MKRFPYPLKTIRVTAFGREFCPYCQRLKLFLEQLYPNDLSSNYKYYDIDKLIANKQAKDFDDFRKKLEPFIGDYQTIPIIFIHGEFVGGFDQFSEIITTIVRKHYSSNKVKEILNTLKSPQNLSIEKRTQQILKLLKANNNKN